MLTGVPPSEWLAMGDRAIATGWDLLEQQRASRRPGGPQMTG